MYLLADDIPFRIEFSPFILNYNDLFNYSGVYLDIAYQ